MENRKCGTLGEGLYLYFYREKKRWVSSKLIKMSHDKGRPPKDLGYKNKMTTDKKESNEINKMDDVYMVIYMFLYTETVLKTDVLKDITDNVHTHMMRF